MKKHYRKFIITIIIFFIISYSAACNDIKNSINNNIPKVQKILNRPQIYIYSEWGHGEKILYDKELIAWQYFYKTQNMRHLFIEAGYSTAQIMNQWMKADDDTLLFELYANWKGTAIYCSETIDFLKSIKQTCPETIFHGTDVGHQYKTNDSMLLRQLEEKGLTDSNEYQIALENIEQAKDFYKNHDYAVREPYMATNFIREFDSLPENEKIMGIYGYAHGSYELDITGKVPSMIVRIRKNYNDDNKEFIKVFDLGMDYYKPPLGIDCFTIKGKSYKAVYYGALDLTGWDDYKYWEFWKIENPDEELRKIKHKGAYCYNCFYPTKVNAGDVFRIEYTKINGSKEVEYYRADGKIYDGELSTNLIIRE